MQNFLIVVDMQNDFIDGALGTAEAVAIVDNVKAKIEGFEGKVIFTRDTHYEDYLTTQEGKNLPVDHCIKDTYGWQIRTELDALRKSEAIDKPTSAQRSLAKCSAPKMKKRKSEALRLSDFARIYALFQTLY